jgi:hypothetical protein
MDKESYGYAQGNSVDPSGAEYHKKPPQSVKAVNAQNATDRIKELKQEIRSLWYEGRGHRYQLGKLLTQLQDERARPKTGTFVKTCCDLYL